MASRNASFHECGIAGIFLAPLKWFCIGAMLLLGLLLAAWIIDGIFVFRVWPDGIARFQGILNQDVARTHGIECWCGNLPKLAVGTANFLYDMIFRSSGIHEMGVRFAISEALSIPDTIVRKAYLANFAEIQVAMLSTQLLGVRAATLLAGLPLLALIHTVALIDGLVQRAVRRACGGRESSSIYHRAKYLQLISLVLSGTIFLLWPYSIDFPAICSIAFGIAAVLARVQWSYYKKHL